MQTHSLRRKNRAATTGHRLGHLVRKLVVNSKTVSVEAQPTAIPAAGSIRSIGVRLSKPPCSSSFSSVLKTGHQRSSTKGSFKRTWPVLDKRFKRVWVLFVRCSVVQVRLEEEEMVVSLQMIDSWNEPLQL
jgi:hypothetical protein